MRDRRPRQRRPAASDADPNPPRPARGIFAALQRHYLADLLPPLSSQWDLVQLSYLLRVTVIHHCPWITGGNVTISKANWRKGIQFPFTGVPVVFKCPFYPFAMVCSKFHLIE